jgi:hypothetical protein
MGVMFLQIWRTAAIADRRLEVLLQTVELAVGQQNFTEGKEELASYELLHRVSSGEA